MSEPEGTEPAAPTGTHADARVRDYLWIEDEATLGSYLAETAAAVGGEERICAVDTEADSLHCYEEKLCLIQFSCHDRHALIDPLAIDDLSALREFLDGATVWMHGADFDMRMLRRTFDWIPTTIYDTQTAARLLGNRKFGLANLVEDMFEVKLSKASQKADWGKRPLSDTMLAYAVNDVRYLIPMAHMFKERLAASGRWDWFTESCEAARDAVLTRPEKDPEELWRIPGWGKLRRRGMAYLRALWFWRDAESRRQDRPPFKILANDQLIRFAQTLYEGGEVNLSPRANRRRVERFREAVSAAHEIPESEWPEPPRRRRSEKNPEADERFERLRDRRDLAAAGLEIDPTLIASRVTMERIAADGTASDELLLNWQKSLLGDAL